MPNGTRSAQEEYQKNKFPNETFGQYLDRRRKSFRKKFGLDDIKKADIKPTPISYAERVAMRSKVGLEGPPAPDTAPGEPPKPSGSGILSPARMRRPNETYFDYIKRMRRIEGAIRPGVPVRQHPKTVAEAGSELRYALKEPRTEEERSEAEKLRAESVSPISSQAIQQERLKAGQPRRIYGKDERLIDEFAVSPRRRIGQPGTRLAAVTDTVQPAAKTTRTTTAPPPAPSPAPAPAEVPKEVEETKKRRLAPDINWGDRAAGWTAKTIGSLLSPVGKEVVEAFTSPTAEKVGEKADLVTSSLMYGAEMFLVVLSDELDKEYHQNTVRPKIQKVYDSKVFQTDFEKLGEMGSGYRNIAKLLRLQTKEVLKLILYLGSPEGLETTRQNREANYKAMKLIRESGLPKYKDTRAMLLAQPTLADSPAKEILEGIVESHKQRPFLVQLLGSLPELLFPATLAGKGARAVRVATPASKSSLELGSQVGKALSPADVAEGAAWMRRAAPERPVPREGLPIQRGVGTDPFKRGEYWDARRPIDVQSIPPARADSIPTVPVDPRMPTTKADPFIPKSNRYWSAPSGTVTRTKRPVRFSSSGSGIGTVELGLRKGSVVSVHVDEFDPDIIKAFNEAHGTNYTPRDIADDASLQSLIASNAKHYHASPVCKNLSAAKVGRNLDPNDIAIAGAVVRNIRTVKPSSITIENVPGYAETDLFKSILKSLDEVGYKWDVDVYDAADYGAAQSRKRLIVRAVLDGELPPLPQKTAPTDWYDLLRVSINEEVAAGRSKSIGEAFKPKKRPTHWETERIHKMIEKGTLDPNKPIITTGQSAGKTVANARNAGGPGPTLTVSGKMRVILPSSRLINATSIKGNEEFFRVVELTPDMLRIYMELPDDVVLPQGQKIIDTVLGNGVHGKITENIIQPIVDAPADIAARAAPATDSRRYGRYWSAPKEIRGTPRYGRHWQPTTPRYGEYWKAPTPIEPTPTRYGKYWSDTKYGKYWENPYTRVEESSPNYLAVEEAVEDSSRVNVVKEAEELGSDGGVVGGTGKQVKPVPNEDETRHITMSTILSKLFDMGHDELGLSNLQMVKNFFREQALKRKELAWVTRTGEGIRQSFVLDHPDAVRILNKAKKMGESLESQSSRIGEVSRLVAKSFDLDDSGRIQDLSGIDPSVPGAPTIQDVAARLPVYRDSLTQEQLINMETLRVMLSPWRKALDDVGIEVGTRTDVMDGGFYISRGAAVKTDPEARVAGLPSRMADQRERLNVYRHEAVYSSQAEGIEGKFDYYSFEDAVRKHISDSGQDMIEEYTAVSFKILKDQEGNLIGKDLAGSIPDSLRRKGERLRGKIRSRREAIKRELARKTVHKKNLSRITKLGEKADKQLLRSASKLRTQAGRERPDTELMDSLSGEINALERTGAQIKQEVTRQADIPGESLITLKKTLEEITTLKDDLELFKGEWDIAKRKAKRPGIGYSEIKGPIRIEGWAFPDVLANNASKIVADYGPALGKRYDELNSLYRGLRSTWDNSGPFIQGLLSLGGGKSKQWRTAMRVNFDSWATPEALGKFLVNYDQMATKAGMPTSSDWASKGLRIGGSATEFELKGGIVGRLPLVQRSNRAFGNFGDSLRLEWVQTSLKEEMKRSGRTSRQIMESGDARRIATTANNVTGWSPSNGFTRWADVVFFAPRFLQARLKTQVDAIQGLRFGPAGRELKIGDKVVIPKKNIQHEESRNAMLRLITYGASLTFAINWALGNETDIRPVVNGRYNSNFMRIRFMGRDFSLFGPYDTLLGLMINTAAGEPTRALRAVGSGPIVIAWDFLSGEDYLGRPVKDTPGNFAMWVYRSTTPFSWSEAPEEAMQIGAGVARGEPLEVMKSVVSAGTEVWGIKSSPKSFVDVVNNITNEFGLGNRYFDIEPFLRKVIIADPRAQEAIDKQKGGSQWYKNARAIELARNKELTEIAETEPTISTYVIHGIEAKYRGMREGLGMGEEFKDNKPKNDNEKALKEYYDLFDDPELRTPAGRIRSQEYDQKLFDIKSTWTSEQREYVLRNTNRYPYPTRVFNKLSRSKKREIGMSREARARYLIEVLGRKDLAELDDRHSRMITNGS